MSSAIPNTFGMSLKISSIFLWNMSPAGAAPRVNIYSDTCQTDKQMWSGITTAYVAIDYGSLSSHQ